MEALLERPLLPRPYEAENSLYWPTVPNSKFAQQPTKSSVTSSNGLVIATRDEDARTKQAAQQLETISKSTPKPETSSVVTAISLEGIESSPNLSRTPSSPPTSTSKLVFPSMKDSAGSKSQYETPKPQAVEPRRWLQTKLARFSTAKSQWADPELSIGIKCNRMGGYQCWEAIGPAKILFEQISVKISDLLEARVDELEEGEPLAEKIIMFGMYMVGKLPETARPTLVFSCQSQKPRRRAIKFLKESAILKDQPKIALAESSIAPVILAGPGVRRTPADEFDDRGLPVICLSSRKRATIGGYVLIDGKCYGMTVAHVFGDPSCHSEELEVVNSTEEVDNTEEALNDDPEFAFDEDSDQEEDTDVEDVAGTSRASMSSVASLSRSGTNNTRSSAFWSDTQSLQTNTDATDPRNIIDRGNPSGTRSTDSRSRTPFACLHISSASRVQLGIDWALVKFSTYDPQIQRSALSLSIPPKDFKTPTRVVSIIQKSAAVIALKGYSGTSSGTISPSTSMIRLPQNRGFQEVWTVRLDGPLVEGDSGSWVVDAQSGDLYGHIAAGLKEKRIAYIIPAYKVFEDISQVFGEASFSLPSVATHDPPSNADDVTEVYNDHKIQTSQYFSLNLKEKNAEAIPQSAKDGRQPIANHLRTPSHTLDNDSTGMQATRSLTRRLSVSSFGSFCAETGEYSEDPEIVYIDKLLALPPFHPGDLLNHIQNYPFKDAGRTLLHSMWRNQVHEQSLKHIFAQLTHEGSLFHVQMFDITREGLSSLVYPQPKATRVNALESFWDSFHHDTTAENFSSTFTAAGRILTIHQGSPTLLITLHHLLNAIFNMDDIFELLIQQNLSVRASFKPNPFSADERARRSFAFSLHYPTIISDWCEPFQWQNSDHGTSCLWSRPALAVSSSVVALCLTGEPVRKVQLRNGRGRDGLIYDIWSPWQVLKIQCFPDEVETQDSHDFNGRYLNGPEAFLRALLSEFHDAEKRFVNIHDQVIQLVKASSSGIQTSVFDYEGLMNFNDISSPKNETYTRCQKYFWAYQTLRVMNESIRKLLDEFHNTFTADFWEGKQKTLWPILEDEKIQRSYQWKRCLSSLKRSFDSTSHRLEKIIELNDTSRMEIKDLREHLFHVLSIVQRQHLSSGQYNRNATNPSLLTTTTMLFLPLILITSIFSLPFGSTQVWVFAGVILPICFLLVMSIWLLNSPGGAKRRELILSKYFKGLGYSISETTAQSQANTNFDYELPVEQQSLFERTQDSYTAAGDSHPHENSPVKLERSNVQWSNADPIDLERATIPLRRKKWFKSSTSSSNTPGLAEEVERPMLS